MTSSSRTLWRFVVVIVVKMTHLYFPSSFQGPIVLVVLAEKVKIDTTEAPTAQLPLFIPNIKARDTHTRTSNLVAPLIQIQENMFGDSCYWYE